MSLKQIGAAVVGLFSVIGSVFTVASYVAPLDQSLPRDKTSQEIQRELVLPSQSKDHPSEIGLLQQKKITGYVVNYTDLRDGPGKHARAMHAIVPGTRLVFVTDCARSVWCKVSVPALEEEGFVLAEDVKRGI